MKKWQFIFLTVILGGLLLLTACGSSATNEEETNEEEETEDIIEEENDSDEEVNEPVEEENTEPESDSESPENSGSDSTDEADEEESSENQSGSDNEDSNKSDSTSSNNSKPSTEIVLENDTFRVFEPAENAVVDKEFIVRGEASTEDGVVRYEFEDGHNIHDEGTVETNTTAPDWGEFEFTIQFDEVAYETGTIILFEELEDGSRANQLYIPVSVK